MENDNRIWGKKKVKIGGKTYYPCIYRDGSFRSIVGYILESPRYFVTDDNLTLVTSDGKYFKVYNTKNYIPIGGTDATAVVGNAIAGTAIVGT